MDANATLTTAEKDSKTRIPPMAQRLIVVFIFGCQYNHDCRKKEATTKDKTTNMLWPMPQRLIVIIIFWVCQYCKAMTTAGTWMRMQHHMQHAA